MLMEGNLMGDNSNKELSLWDAVLGTGWGSGNTNMFLKKKV